jgi:RimJ/RimL family protein N-acetyltransferase
VKILLEPWSENDLDLLRQINTAQMKKFLGGPETDDQLVTRNRRYTEMNDPQTGRIFRVMLLPEDVAVGTVGYWEREWQGVQVYEAGWSVLPGYQGRGIAVAATLEVIEAASAQDRHRFLHAYPKVDNAASNAVCRKAGFALLGPSDFEYPPGNPITCNDWRYDLHAAVK